MKYVNKPVIDWNYYIDSVPVGVVVLASIKLCQKEPHTREVIRTTPSTWIYASSGREINLNKLHLYAWAESVEPAEYKG